MPARSLSTARSRAPAARQHVDAVRRGEDRARTVIADVVVLAGRCGRDCGRVALVRAVRVERRGVVDFAPASRYSPSLRLRVRRGERRLEQPCTCVPSVGAFARRCSASSAPWTASERACDTTSGDRRERAVGLLERSRPLAIVVRRAIRLIVSRTRSRCAATHAAGSSDGTANAKTRRRDRRGRRDGGLFCADVAAAARSMM